ncbi:zinc finger (c3hc4 ring finger) domain-containing protein [Cyclospora cayetanensis]|uniref:Zinc finger (C3hc4 ring finger) domain-containing protein n=1 Tax=Cyclospora cayetanensis TaxID=88456 RepID=A0A1D3D8V0_9EIME|nr:zinc finger (c3hc4 ring finger) domain-containing protein [Cyclospora cayetanensis]
MLPCALCPFDLYRFSSCVSARVLRKASEDFLGVPYPVFPSALPSRAFLCANRRIPFVRTPSQGAPSPSEVLRRQKRSRMGASQAADSGEDSDTEPCYAFESEEGLDVSFPLKAVEKSFRCSLCTGYLRDAVTIKECLHTFCRWCLYSYAESGEAEEVCCPFCERNLQLAAPHRDEGSLRLASARLCHAYLERLEEEELQRYMQQHQHKPIPPEYLASSIASGGHFKREALSHRRARLEARATAEEALGAPPLEPPLAPPPEEQQPRRQASADLFSQGNTYQAQLMKARLELQLEQQQAHTPPEGALIGGSASQGPHGVLALPLEIPQLERPYLRVPSRMSIGLVLRYLATHLQPLLFPGGPPQNAREGPLAAGSPYGSAEEAPLDLEMALELTLEGSVLGKSHSIDFVTRARRLNCSGKCLLLQYRYSAQAEAKVVGYHLAKAGYAPQQQTALADAAF